MWENCLKKLLLNMCKFKINRLPLKNMCNIQKYNYENPKIKPHMLLNFLMLSSYFLTNQELISC